MNHGRPCDSHNGSVCSTSFTDFIKLPSFYWLPKLHKNQVSDTQPAVQHISSHNGDVFEPVQSLSANDKGSGGETIIVTDTSSPTSSF